jgi:tRNA(Ile)-lysidine synthase
LQVDSGTWATHVAHWAKAQQIPCRILRAQVNGHDEQAARQARYDVMRAQLNQDDVLLLAHHADDQAETVLMRLIQGAGVNGLSGMQPWRIQTQGAQRMALWRPWLTVKRVNISNYAQCLKLPYINDPTNDAGDNVRSGLRLDIMPVLATYNSNVIDNIARSAQLLSDAQLIINAQAAEDLQQTEVVSSQLPPAQRVLNIDKLKALPIYRQRQLLHHWLGQDEPLPPAKQLVDDVFMLSQRDDPDHQTALFWQGRKQSYTIYRYRQQLYRLSSEWLKWLALPLAKQLQPLFNLVVADIDTMSAQPVSVTLRRDNKFTWQVQMMPDILAELLDSYQDDDDSLEITFAPLGRQQRVQTALASRPQAGKKLYQTLGVPVWLRESLVVVSAVSVQQAKEWPLLLVSPFESWILGTSRSLTDTTENIGILDSAIRNNVISNSLSINNAF